MRPQQTRWPNRRNRVLQSMLSIAPGVPLVLEYYNGPDLKLDWALIERAAKKIEESGSVTMPLAHYYRA